MKKTTREDWSRFQKILDKCQKLLISSVKYYRDLAYKLDLIVYTLICFISFFFGYPSNIFLDSTSFGYIIIYIIITSVFYFGISTFLHYISTKMKKKLKIKDSLKNFFLWHALSWITGLLIYLYLYIFREPQSDLYEISILIFFTAILLLGYITFSIFFYISLKIYETEKRENNVKKKIQKFKDMLNLELSFLDRFHTRFGFYIGLILDKSYHIIIIAAQGIIILFSYLFLSCIFLMFVLIIPVILLTFFDNFWNGIVVSVIIVLYICLILGLMRLLILIHQNLIPHVILFIVNLVLGIYGEYKAINTTLKPRDQIVLIESVKQGIMRYWQPIIELSFFLLAFHYFQSQILKIPEEIAIIVTVIFGSLLMFVLWIFDDLTVDTIAENEIDYFFSFIKTIRFSKKSIQFASIYTVGMWFFQPQNSTFNEIPILSFVVNLFGSGIILILVIGIINLFSWVFLRLVRPNYYALLVDIQKRITNKTKEIEQRVNENNNFSFPE